MRFLLASAIAGVMFVHGLVPVSAEDAITGRVLSVDGRAGHIALDDGRIFQSTKDTAIVRQHQSVRLADVKPGDVVDLYGVRTLAWPSDTTTSTPPPLQPRP